MEIKALIKKWKGNQRYTLKFLDVIEDEHLKFKPVDGSKTYVSQLSHITTWLRTHSRFVTGQAFPKSSLKNLEDIRLNLDELFESLLSFLENTTEKELSETVKLWYGTVSKESVLLTMDNHLSHHRGQLVVYLRLMGIKPPSYIGW